MAATTTASSTFLTLPGPVAKSAARDPTQQPGMKELFCDPVIADLIGLKDGTNLAYGGTPGVAAAVTTAEVKVAVVTNAGPRIFAGREFYKLVNKNNPILTAADIDCPTDGVTSAVATITAAMAGGPVTIFLDVPAGLVIDANLDLKSGCEVVVSARTPLLVGPAGAVRAYGYWKEDFTLAPLKLLSDASNGATTFAIDTTPAGAGALSGFFAAADRVVIRHPTDATKRYESKVTAEDNNARTITCADAITFDCPASDGAGHFAQVTRQTVLHLAVDAAADARVVAVQNSELSRVALYDYVILMDDQNAGSASALCNVESAQVVGIETDGANTITLDRPLRRAKLAASGARVQVLSPVTGARFTGGRVTFTAGPSAARVDTFEIAYAVDCFFADLQVPNEDAFGSRGQMFRCYRAYRSGFEDARGARPKYTGAGEGVGWSCLQSTECSCVRSRFDSCTFSFTFEASTDCWHELMGSNYPVHEHGSFNGCDERGCWGRLVWARGGVNLATFGSTVNKKGATDCYLELATSANPSGAHVEIIAPSTRCGVRGIDFTGGTNALHATDHPLDNTLVGADNYLIGGVVRAITTGYAVLIDGGTTDNTARGQLRPLVQDVDFLGCDQHFRVYRCTSPRLIGLDVFDPAAQTDPSCVNSLNASGLEVSGCTLRGVKSAFSLQNAVNGRIFSNCYVNMTVGHEYSDNGGNTGLEGTDNAWIGFVLDQFLPV